MIQALDRQSNRIARPESKGKLQLIRCLVYQKLLNDRPCSTVSLRFAPFRRPLALGCIPSLPFRRYACHILLACDGVVSTIAATSRLLFPCFRRRTTCLRNSYWVWGLSDRASVSFITIINTCQIAPFIRRGNNVYFSSFSKVFFSRGIPFYSIFREGSFSGRRKNTLKNIDRRISWGSAVKYTLEHADM